MGWYGGIYEPGDIEVTRRSIAIRNLPARLDGMTAVQISDLHLHQGDAAPARMVELVKQANPHYVFFTGDLINDAAIAPALDTFRAIQPPGGTWAVIGNSDRTSGLTDVLVAQLRAQHVRYLLNEAVELEAGLWLAGVDDPSAYDSDVPSAVASIPANAPRLLLAHSPDIVDQLEGARFDLMLAGHTHGGQINLPLFSAAWLHEGPSRQYVDGLYDVQGIPLYVNRGIGTSHIPLRIGARPEITHFTFHAA